MRVLVVGHGLIGRQRAAALVELGQAGGARLAGTVDPRARAQELYGGPALGFKRSGFERTHGKQT